MRKPHGRPENFLTPVKPKDEPADEQPVTEADVAGTTSPPPFPFGVPLPFPDDVTAETPLGDD